MKIDDTPPQSQTINYSKCRFKTGDKSKFEGEEANSKCEGYKNNVFQYVSSDLRCEPLNMFKTIPQDAETCSTIGQPILRTFIFLTCFHMYF